MRKKIVSFVFNLRMKALFYLSFFLLVGLSEIVFISPCQALYIDNSTHINPRIEKSTNLPPTFSDVETLPDHLKVSDNKQIEKKSKQYAFSFVNLIEIISTAIVTGLGIKFLASDRLLNNSKTVKELRGRIEDLEEVIIKIDNNKLD